MDSEVVLPSLWLWTDEDEMDLWRRRNSIVCLLSRLAVDIHEVPTTLLKS